MEHKMAFQRNFLIFTNEDAGFEAGQKPTGHVRVEIREGKGKLWSTVQNLASGNGKLVHKLYLVKAGKEPAAVVSAGVYGLRQNKAELEWAFDPGNVSGSGSSIADFDVFAVVSQYNDRENNRIICPLAAYRTKGTDWRKKLEKLTVSPNKAPQPIQKEYIPSNQTTVKENVKLQKSEALEVKAPVAGNETAPPKSIPEEVKKEPPMAMKPQQESTYIEIKANKFTPPDDMPDNDINLMPVQSLHQHGIHMPYNSVNMQKDETFEPAAPINQNQMNQMPEQVQEPQYYNQMNQMPEQVQEQQYYNQMNQMPEQVPELPEVPLQMAQAAANLNSNCLYMNGNMCGMYVNTGGPSPCSTCKLYDQAPNAVQEDKKGDLEKLKELLAKNFEQNDPFQVRRSDYKWWKIANPVNLNNILYLCNIRSPLLFNPMVMMAHFKYRHLILGIFTDKVRKREYVVCGVPGMHMLDKKPFGDMCRFVQTEGSRPRYGGFGYFVVYLDPVTGKILSLKE